MVPKFIKSKQNRTFLSKVPRKIINSFFKLKPLYLLFYETIYISTQNLQITLVGIGFLVCRHQGEKLRETNWESKSLSDFVF